MKIIKLTSENIKRIEAVEIIPKSNIVLITGENEAGKTSVLDSIMWALAGKETIPTKPIREGQKKGKIEVDLGDYKVTRVFTENNSYLEVTNSEGFKSPSPQALLDSIVGRLAFNPLEFAEMKPKEQREMLMRSCCIDTTGIDSKIETTYNNRTFQNRILINLKGTLETIQHPDKMPERIDVNEKMNRIKLLNNQKREYQIAQNSIKTSQNRIANLDQQIENIKESINSEKKTIQDAMKMQAPDETEINLLSDEINKAGEIERQVNNFENWEIKKNEIGNQIKIVELLNIELEENREQKKKMLDSIKLPVGGLELSDIEVLFNGIPFNQLNEAEQIRVSMAIAMKMNPKLKVIRIAGGSSLGTKILNSIKTMADTEDYQVWIEKMDESGKIGIVIKEGKVETIN